MGRAKMARWGGSGCCKFQGKEADNCARVGREEEDTSSNRPELGGIVLALQSAALSEDVLLMCDNPAVLCAIKKWVGQGRKATLATAPDAGILQEIGCLLTQRVRAGRATFLIKVKSHPGEPINERADTRAKEGRDSDDNKRWDVRTEEERAIAAKHWTERVWYCHNQRWMRSTKEETAASRSGSFKNGQEWGKKCFEDLDQWRMGRPATRTWSTDFLLREGSSLEEIGRWLKNKSVP
jgi:ribonuclease HI